MLDQTSWKGHSFTLLVFAGIVILCSIFFILGMLVGRTQGQKMASVAAEAQEKSVERAPAKEPTQMTFYDSVEEKSSPFEESIVEKPAPQVLPAAKAPVPGLALNYQIAALSKRVEAQKMLDELKQKNFKAFILAPPPGESNPLYRVQVGPFSEQQEADAVKRRLESAGYNPIVKR